MTVQEYMTALAGCGADVEATLGTMPTPAQDAMVVALAMLELARDQRRTVHLFGNGGSAAIVAHAQNDMVKACGMRAMVYQDIPLLTAYANDEGYDKSIVRAMTVWMQDADVVLAVSSSGMSANIVSAAKAARERGATLITLSGFSAQNHLRQLGNVNFYVPAWEYGQVELTHAALLHYLTDQLAHA